MNKEITLREIIELIIKRKWLICIITITTLLLSAIYCFFIQKPYYSASVTLLGKPIEDKQTSITDISGMVDTVAVYPNMTLDTYKEQVINSIVLTDTINDLNLTNSDGELIQWSELARKISVDKINNTNMLRVTVNDSDPQAAAKIANSIADNFIEFISDNTRKFGEQAMSLIEEKLKEEENKIKEEAIKLKEYLSNSHNIEQLKLEKQGLLDKINQYSMKLIDVEKQIQTDSKVLEDFVGGKYASVPADNQNDIMYNIPLGKDVEIIITSADDLKGTLQTIKLSEIENRLLENQAEKLSLETKIDELVARLNDTQVLLAEEEYKYNAIIRDYNLAEQKYNAYSVRHKEAVLAATSSIGENAIIVSSPATEPNKPASHGKGFYLALGLSIGLLISAIVTFSMAFWTITDPKRVKQN